MFQFLSFVTTSASMFRESVRAETRNNPPHSVVLWVSRPQFAFRLSRLQRGFGGLVNLQIQ